MLFFMCYGASKSLKNEGQDREGRVEKFNIR